MAGRVPLNSVLWDAIYSLIANSDLGIHVSPDQELDIESLYNQVVTAYSEQTAREAESQKTGSDSNEIPIDLNHRVSQQQLAELCEIFQNMSSIQS